MSAATTRNPPNPIVLQTRRTATLKSARRARVLAIGIDRAIADALAAPTFDGEVARVDSLAPALEVLLGSFDVAYDVILCNARAHDDSGIDLYRLLAKHRPEIAPRVVFVLDDGTSARAHWFLGDVPNATVDAGSDGRSIRAVVLR